MNLPAGDGASTSPPGSPEGLEPAVSVVMPGHAEPTIYDVARVAGVAPSTVSLAEALSKPDGHRIIHTVMATARLVPRNVSVIGFDNIVDSLLWSRSPRLSPHPDQLGVSSSGASCEEEWTAAEPCG